MEGTKGTLAAMPWPSGSGSGSGTILHKLHDWDVNMQAQSTEQYA